ncbi:hypothetical protein Cgig2_017062 [Carnegiea gigantea]|uniref:Uncharacterized protein n=1 Tax=Carnegiea gigantea TaxID=171969 RepID=A0A9Q1JTS9_9CARY|nr:hypothetical protein Cgig2_017062 [Carnegiea gigantea]
MAFPRSLDTKAMGEDIIRHFAWDRRRVAFPLSSLPKDFQALCPSFELAVAKEAAEYYELPELPQSLLGVLSMAFPCSLDTKAMGEYVICHFAWDCRAVAFPLSPLPKDFQPPCLSFELSVTEEAAKYYKLLELSQVIFYAMLLNEAKRLGLSHGRALRSLESALIELRWSTFEPWVWLYADRIFKARFHPKGNGRAFEKVLCLALEESFASASSPSRRFSRPLISRFLLPEAEGATTNFELPEMVQVTFYAMLLNEAVKLGVASGFMAQGLKSALVGLRWLSFEVWMGYVDHKLREAQLRRQAIAVEVRDPLDGQEESSR